MIHSPVTAGERLCVLLYARIVEPSNWDALRHSFGLARRADEYVELFQEILTVNLTCRIVATGTSLAAECAPADPLFEQAFRRALIEMIGIPRRELAAVYRNAVDAVRAADHGFTERELQRMRRAAQSRNSPCYMCGGRIDYDGTGRPYEAYSLEHDWPRADGGDSIDEHALPACRSCNERKADFVSWGMVAVQSLILGLNPTADRLDEMDKTFKFAMHHRAARRLAHIEKCSMSQAFRRLGPWWRAEMVEEVDLADFFNLRNHRQDARLA